MSSDWQSGLKARVFEGTLNDNSLLIEPNWLRTKRLDAGWIGREAILMTGINSVIYILSTIPTYVNLFPSNVVSKLIDPPAGISSTDGDVELSYFLELSWFVFCFTAPLPVKNWHSYEKMAAALMATGWWMYVDVPQTPNAVVLCVIIFNAAFGYR